MAALRSHFNDVQGRLINDYMREDSNDSDCLPLDEVSHYSSIMVFHRVTDYARGLELLYMSLEPRHVLHARCRSWHVCESFPTTMVSAVHDFPFLRFCNRKGLKKSDYFS